jgi:hypothetical protein
MAEEIGQGEQIVLVRAQILVGEGVTQAVWGDANVSHDQIADALGRRGQTARGMAISAGRRGRSG